MNKAKAREEIAKLIKEARLQTGLSQEAVADRMGISRPGYAKYENGISAPGAVQFICIFEAMGLDPGSEMVKLIERLKA